MKTKRIAAIVLVVVGIIVFLLALYAQSRVSDAKASVSKSSGMFSDNPVNKQITGAIQGKISAYDAPILWTMIGGVVLVLAGVGTYIYYRKKW
jgi:hypothetical protein